MNCIICSETLIPTSKIYSTNCGHVFHYVCLSQWFDRSSTCPECRHRATKETIHRLYFNSNIDYEVSTEENEKLQHQNAGLRKEVLHMEQKQRVSESAIHALKEQVSYFELKAKETLKKLTEADRKSKLLNTKMKQLQNDVSRYRRDNSEFLKENVKLKNDMESHKNCEAEKHYLRKKITDIESKLHNMETNTPNYNMNRIVMESPSPSKKRKSIELEIDSSIYRNPLPACYVILNKYDYNYNGFGGHSKREDFAKPKPNIGLK